MANGTNVSLNYAGILNADNGSIGGPAVGGNASGTGNGGTASMNVAGNIFKPLGAFLTVNASSTGGNGAGNGNGGNATSTSSGNIVNASLAMPITFTALAQAGQGAGTGKDGNATASLSGNIINANNNGGSDVTLNATAKIFGSTNFTNNLIDSTAFNGNNNYGTKTASVTGNILNGYINNATISADAFLSNATANISGNILNSKPSGTGNVVVEAEGQKINITGNILNLGQQELDITLNELAGPTFTAPVVSGNIFNGTNSATNNLVLAANFFGAAPSSNTASIDLGAGTLLINGQSNIINKFSGATLGNGFSGSITGSSGNNTLNGGAGDDFLSGLAGNDTLNGFGGNDILFGGTGNDNDNGGLGLDVAWFSGRETQYTSVSLASVTGGPDGNDTLTGVERLKFLSPSHVSDVNNNGYGDLIFQDATGPYTIHVTTLGPGATSNNLTTLPVNATTKVIGTGQFNPDVNRQSDILLQDSANGDLSVLYDINGAASTGPVNFSVQPGSPNWQAIATGDFNGDAAWDVLLQNSSTNAVEILQLNSTAAGEGVGAVDATLAVTTPGLTWKVISSGDFNGDGKSDILWQDSTTKAIDISLMNGGSGSPVAIGSGTGFTAVGSGDFNNDGKSDILLRNNATGDAQLWLMNGTTQIGAPINVTGPGAGWTLKGSEDVNNDGFSDLLWQDSVTGNVDVQLMTTGATPSGPLSLLALGPTPTFGLIASTGGG